MKRREDALVLAGFVSADHHLPERIRAIVDRVIDNDYPVDKASSPTLPAGVFNLNIPHDHLDHMAKVAASESNEHAKITKELTGIDVNIPVIRTLEEVNSWREACNNAIPKLSEDGMGAFEVSERMLASVNDKVESAFFNLSDQESGLSLPQRDIDALRNYDAVHEVDVKDEASNGCCELLPNLDEEVSSDDMKPYVPNPLAAGVVADIRKMQELETTPNAVNIIATNSRKLNESDIPAITKLLAAGGTPEKFCKQFGCSGQTIRNFMKKHSLEQPFWTPEKDAIVWEGFSEGIDRSVIAKQISAANGGMVNNRYLHLKHKNYKPPVKEEAVATPHAPELPLEPKPSIAPDPDYIGVREKPGVVDDDWGDVRAMLKHMSMQRIAFTYKVTLDEMDAYTLRMKAKDAAKQNYLGNV